MPQARIKRNHFSGAGKVFDVHSDDGLGMALRGVAQMLARNLVAQRSASLTDLTDNSTGTAGGSGTARTLSVVAVPAPFTEVGTASAPKAAFDTALGKIADAVKELSTRINAYNTFLGLPALTDNGGGTAADGTIAAMDKTVTAVASLCLDATTGREKIAAVGAALDILSIGAKRITTACGGPTLTGRCGTGLVSTLTIPVFGTTGASTSGANNTTLSKVGVDAALLAAANNVATLTALLSSIGGGTTDAVVPPVVAWDV